MHLKVADHVNLGKSKIDLDSLVALTDHYQKDKAIRAKLESDPKEFLLERYGMDLSGLDVRIVTDTPETCHLVLPLDPNTALSDETLNELAGGSTVGSAGCAATKSTLGSAPSCIGCAGTASTIGTAGSSG